MSTKPKGIKISTRVSKTGFGKRKESSKCHSSFPPPSSSSPPPSGTPDSDLLLIEGNPTSHISKKTRSEVWKYFEKEKDSDDNDTGKAICSFCKTSYGCKSEAGTSGLWKHLRETCKKCPSELKKRLVDAHRAKDKTQKVLTFSSSDNGGEGKLSSWKFDQEKVRNALVQMIIKDELPFRFVVGEGFKDFVETAVPMFQVPSRYTIARDCFSLFVIEKKRLKDQLQNLCQSQRVSFTTDTWTSLQNVNYLCLTAHFIDSNWNLHKRILNFCPIKSHKGVNIGNAIDFCLDEWGIRKVMCITVDNASSNDTAIQQLKKRLLKKDAFVLGGEAFQMRCFAHILQLIVRDGLEIADGSIKRIRNVVKYVRGSPQRLDLFRKCCADMKIESKACLQLDCATRWNSTYLMLETALIFQKAFDKFEDVDEKMTAEFAQELPTENDWFYAAHFTKFLKRFYDVTCKLSGSLYSTSSMYFPEIIRTLKDLDSYEKSNDSNLVEMGKQMRAKFNKYWGSISKMNVMLFIACVLDPRYKMKYLRVKYQLYYSEKEADDLVDKVTRSLEALVGEYSKMQEDNTSGENLSNKSQNMGMEAMQVDEDIDEYFLEEENLHKLNTKGELERYLEEYSEKYTHEFNILTWWKVNSVRFPILSCIARDVLPIQSSTVASESAFSTGGRTLDCFRSSLTPTTVEVLICLQDWLRRSKTPIETEENIEDSVKMESDAIKDPEVLSSLLGRMQLEC